MNTQLNVEIVQKYTRHSTKSKYKSFLDSKFAFAFTYKSKVKMKFVPTFVIVLVGIYSSKCYDLDLLSKSFISPSSHDQTSKYFTL